MTDGGHVINRSYSDKFTILNRYGLGPGLRSVDGINLAVRENSVRFDGRIS